MKQITRIIGREILDSRGNINSKSPESSTSRLASRLLN